MTIQLDLSTDFETIADNLETVTLARRVPAPVTGISATRHGGYHDNAAQGAGLGTESLTKCLRREVSNAEVVASDGKYLAGDTRWHLSANELTSRPRPGDTLTDADSDTYTIVEVRRDTFDTRWRCISRNLRVVHNLNQIIDVQLRTITKGTAGAAEDTWATTWSDIPARIQEVRSDNTIEGGARRAEKSYMLWLADDKDLSTGHRVLIHGGTKYEILGHSNREAIAFMQTLECREWRRG